MEFCTCRNLSLTSENKFIRALEDFINGNNTFALISAVFYIFIPMQALISALT